MSFWSKRSKVFYCLGSFFTKCFEWE